MAVKWENDIMGFIPRRDWLDIPFRIDRPNDPFGSLFGNKKTDNIVAEWSTLAAQYRIPVMAQFHGFDTEAQTAIRFPIDHNHIEEGLIKRKINQSERMRSLLDHGVTGDRKLYDLVVNDGLHLAESVITRTKVAIAELLATGHVTIKENHLDLTVDYGVPAEHTNLSLDISEGEDVFGQIQNIFDIAESKGQTITGMITSKKVLTKLRANANVQTAINGNYEVGATVKRSALEDYLSEEFGINRIITNDQVYGKDTSIGADGRPIVHTQRYYPDDTITFIAPVTANGQLGMGLWGDSPEADLKQLDVAANSGVSPYIYITQWETPDPAALWTKASTLFMPMLYSPESLYIVTVDED